MEIFLIILAVFIGIILGLITGLTPGIHINLIAAIIVAYSSYLLKLTDPISISIIITSMTITHTVSDIIPSTLLGIPDSENLTMLLPAHKLTIEGKTKLAIYYGLIGSAIGIITTTLLSPLIIILIKIIYEKIKNHIGVLLIIISVFVIIKSKNKLYSLIFFITTGIIGILSFNIKTIDQPLLPLLSGIFGLSVLILGIKNKIIIPEQKEVKINLTKKELIKYSTTTTIASFLTNFLPGLTSSYTALLSNKISKVKNQDHYILLSNAANSSAIIISFIALFSIDKARSGAVATIKFFLNEFNIINLILLISITLITLGISTLLAIKLTNKIIKYVNKIDYKKISISVIFLIILLVIIMTKLEGLIILIITTSLGILAENLKIEKIALTGCLVLPVILYTLL